MNQTNILQRSAVPAAIEDWLDRAESDRRFNVLACGVPGMGKSHVATSLLEAARRRGFRTVLAGPSPAGLPYQLLAQLGSESPSAAVLESAHIFWLARLGLTEAEARGPVAVVFEDIDAYDVSDLAFVREIYPSLDDDLAVATTYANETRVRALLGDAYSDVVLRHGRSIDRVHEGLTGAIWAGLQRDGHAQVPHYVEEAARLHRFLG